jgi:hypothetical protein
MLLLLLYLDTTQVFASTPTIGSIETQSTHINTATNPISFTVSDGESGPLTIICSTSNSLFVSNTAFNLENSGHWIYVVSITGGENKALTLIITPENGSSGTCDITITVIDSEDLSGSTHFLLIVSPPGAGNALNFNGEGKGVSATIATKNTNFCMELWIKWSGSFGNYPYFVSFIACNGSTGSKGFAIYLTPDTRYLGYFCSSGFGIDNIGRTPLVDEWEHVALVINEGTLSFYANGVLELTATGTPSELDGVLNLGNSGNTQEYYIGQIDELRIWDAPRSETQIRDNMCKRLIGNETNLVTYYRFDHSSGTELKDLSRNGNHGILNNMNNGNWVLSSAAIGEMSTYDYNGTIASDFVVNLTSPNGDQLTATGDGGSYSSMHIYLINESPNVTSPPTGWNAIDTDHYWGIFPVGTNPTYEITYDYNGNPFVSDENAMKLAYRKDNSISSWSRSTATINTGANTITKNNETRAEYILAENMIEISTIESQSTSLSEIPFTITHQTGDNVNVTVTSLNESLIENAKIDVAGSGSNSYTQLMTAGVPVSLTITVIAADNINGFVTLTVTATDSNGVTITNDCRVIISPPGTGPGGIGRIDGLSHLELWLRSDMGVNYSSTDLVSWENQSGYTGRDANNVGGAPDYLDNQINGYPMISFDGVNDYLTGSTPGLNFSDSNLTIFLVSAIHQIPSDNYYGIFSLAASGLNDWDDPDGMCFSLHPTNSLQCNMLQYYGSNKMEVFKDVGSTSFQIFTLERNNGNACITINALNTDSDTYSDSSPIKPDKYVISARWTSGSVDSNMRGENDYAEIIIYNGALANVEQNIIHNYLSAKYNIAIASADKYSGDTTANGDFDMDVAGIGKDTEGINNIANSGGLILNGTNFLVDNGDYIFAGHAEISNGFVAENTSSEINRRMLRIWYIDRTDGGGANNGKLTISFDYSDAGLLDAPSDANMYSLLFRSDRNSDFTILPVLSMEINGDKIIFEISDNYLLDGYYTLGTFETEISDIQDQIESSIHYINQTAVLYFSITSNDAPCSLTITMISSDTSILPNENLSVVCENNHYTATLQPLTNMSGPVNITLVATSANGLTSSSTIALMFSSNLSGAGRALSFDGIDDLIDLSQVPTTGSGAFTIEAWIKTSEQGRRKQIVNYGDLSTNNGAWLLINPSDQLEMDWSNTAGPTSTLIITDGIWHHVVGVYESGNITLYVDGNPDGSASIATPNIGTSMARIGYPLPSNGAEWIYKGQMDDIRIWNIARTEAQIQTNMNKKLIGTESGLVAYYRFDHTNGDTLLDLTAYENHGFLTQTMDTVASWTVSTAPIGDFSHSGAGVSNLTATETVPVTITWTDDPGADAFYSAIQVNDFPEKTTGLLLNYPATYWEIYLAKPDMAVTGTIAFKYDDVGIVEDENNLQLYGRATAIADWVALTGITLDVQGNSNDGLGSIIISNHDILSGAKQFILTSDSTDNCFFSVSSIEEQTTNINTAISIVLSVSQTEAQPLTLTIQSSDIGLVLANTISITGTGAIDIGSNYLLDVSENIENYTATIVPETDASGSCEITFTVINPTGVKDQSILILNITNGAPDISLLDPQVTLENLSISLALSITDTINGVMSLTGLSSNEVLVTSQGLQFTHASMGANSNGYLLTVLRNEPETITLTITPSIDAYGNSEISITIINGNGLTASESFMLTVVDAASRSISFDGINDHIIYDTHFSVDPTNAIAIESWIYLYTNTTDMAILSYGNELHDSIVLEHKNYNLEMRLKNISKTEFVNFRNLSADGLPIKKWYHVCVMWNNSLNKAYCLINGQLRHGDTFSSDAIGYSGSRQLNIGSFFGQNKWFQGRLDDIRLWKTALPITTIRQWMYQVITEEHPYYSDLLACYPISAVAGNLIFDNRNHHHAYLYENSIIGSGPTRSQFVAVNNWLNTHTNDWNDPMNWSGHFVPTENNPGFVIINAGIRKPVLSVASSVNNLVLPVGASYMASTPYPLTVHGKIYNRLNASNINIGHSLTIFSSIDFKTDRIPPESIDYSITVAPSESSIHLIFMMATDDQSLTSSLQYAVVMSDYSLSCVDTISHIAGNITPCDAQLVIPFQTVSESGSGETIRSAGGNSAEVDVESLDSNNNYYFNVLVMDGDNNIRGYQAVQFGGIGE